MNEPKKKIRAQRHKKKTKWTGERASWQWKGIIFNWIIFRSSECRGGECKTKMHLDRHTGRRTKKSSKHKHSDNNSSGKAGKIWNKKKKDLIPSFCAGREECWGIKNSIQKPSATPTSLSSEFWNRKTKNLLVREMQELNTTKKTRKLWGTIKSIQVEGRGHRTACSKEVWHKILLFFCC